MATNIESLRMGAVYSKAMDYLLPFSLRFRLAGKKEQKYHTACHAAADKKKNLDKDKPNRYTHKSWKDDVGKSQSILGNELRQSQDASMDQERARTSLQEPDFPGPTGQFTGLTQNGGCPAPYEDLEDEDDIADQEMEQEKQRTSSDLSMTVKEPSRAHLKSIQAVTRMLLESPTLQGALTVDYIRACFHQPGLVSDMECDAVIETVQALRDYVPRRRLKTTGGTAPPAQHIATMIGGHFDPHVTKETAVTSVPKARSRANALFECFFDMDRIRLKYVDRHPIHILGDVIPEDQERGPGAPVRRELVEESKKKGSKGTRGGVYWSREGERIGVTQEIARDKAKQAQKRLLTLETDQKDRRKVYLQADSDRSEASKIVKALSKGVDDSVDPNQQDRAWHEAYDKLYQTRRVASKSLERLGSAPG
ncbi:hypothetical protein BGZ89_006699, partial [Linnemannia elongata]